MIFPSLVQLATKDVITLDASQSLKEAVHLMNAHHIRDMIVTHEQTYSILTARELIDFQIRKIPLSTPLSDLQLNIVPQMSANDSVMKALMVIQNHPDNHVCLINEDKDIIGIVSYSDLANSLQPDQLVQSQPIGEIVGNKPFLQVDATESLQTVFEKLHRLNETAAIVMRQQQAVGMITQTNVIALLDQEQNWQKPVAEYMTTPLITVCSTASVQYALALSREHHIKHVVVKDSQQVIGVLHQKDLVSLVYQSLHQRYENETQQVEREMDLLKVGPVVSVIWKMSPGWPVKYVTPNLSKVLGYRLSEWRSPNFQFSDLIHPDDIERVSREVAKHLAEKASYWEQRYRLLSKQGQWRWFYDYSQPIYGENHQAEEVFGYLLDQTHLVTTEQALQQSEQQYRSLFDLYPLATVLFDPDTQLPVRFNQQAHQQLGYSAEIFSHLRIADYEVLESEQKVRNRIAQVMTEGQTQFETQHRHQSGKVLDIKVTVKLLKLDGKLYLLSVFEDISALKQSQKALQLSHQKELQASEEKSQFLAYLSHEIRTPLSGMIGLCELSQSVTDYDSLKVAATQVSQAAQQLMSLMNDLLDLSKMEAKQLTLSLRPLHLDRVVKEVMALAQGMKRPEQPVELVLSYDASIPAVLDADHLRLRQVLMNLLSNAIKFTEQGQVRLEIGLVELKNDQAWVKFTVTDTGMGLSKSDLVYLFKPYHQGQSIEQRAGGTGLGLAISQQLVQLMQGTHIEVTSELGKGSCFAFKVPFSIETQARPESPSVSVSSVKNPLQGRVLVAEDDVINQQVIRQQLKALGVTDVVLVSDGAQAIAQAQQQSFDLVLMDGLMPVLNGFDASRRLLELKPDLPIIILSASDRESDRQSAQQLGIRFYLTKPVDLSTLYTALSTYLNMTESHLNVKPILTALTDTETITVSQTKQIGGSVLIDFQQGLRQLNGNQALYLKLLKQFLEQLHGDYRQLTRVLAKAAKTPVSAAELSWLQAQNHSMKGVAANLALTALYEISQQIDTDLKQQRSPNPELAETLSQVMSQTEQAIRDQLAIQPEAETLDKLKANSIENTDRLSQDQLKVALTHLLDNLRSQRYLDIQQLHPLWASLPDALQSDYGTALIEAIENFEFEQAIHNVQHLLEALQEKSV